jgi:hypothetical protein
MSFTIRAGNRVTGTGRAGLCLVLFFGPAARGTLASPAILICGGQPKAARTPAFSERDGPSAFLTPVLANPPRTRGHHK